MTPFEFLQRMFAGRTKCGIFLCSYANDRVDAKKFPPRDTVINLKDPDAASQVKAFVDKSDIPGRATYFAVSTVLDRKRNKDEIAEINVLHTDLDFKGIVESPEQIVEVLRKLKHPPSAVVASGHGLHCYWLLQPALDPAMHTGTVERLLQQLAEKLAGDVKAAEIARVLRLPGSHNSKNDEWLSVELVKDLCSWSTYSIALLDKWLHQQEPVLTYKSTKKDLERAAELPLNIWQEFGRETRELAGGFDADELIKEMVFHDVQGHGIDDTYTAVVGGMVAAGASLEEVLKTLLRPTKRVYERDREAGESPWSEKRAIKEIKQKYRYFTRRDRQKEDTAPEETGEISGAKETAPAEEISSGKKLNGVKHHVFDDGLPEEKYIGVDPDPFDPFVESIITEMPRGALPEEIEDIAFDEARRMGVDAGVLGMSMLTCLSSLIPASLRLKVKRATSDRWHQRATIWTAIVGDASSKKSPAIKAALDVIRGIDIKLRKEYDIANIEYKNASKEERNNPDNPIEKPIPNRVMISDVTPERAATLMSYNPEGLLYTADELIRIFGNLDRYGGGGSSTSSRGMWLSAFDSVLDPVDREGRDTPSAPHIKICMLGGIQPDVISRLINDEKQNNDGLVQRFFNIYSKKGQPGLDIDVEHPIENYENLALNIYSNLATRKADLHFSDKGHAFKDIVFKWIENIQNSALHEHKELAEHLGKWENMFVRLCLTYHVIKHWDKIHIQNIGITQDTVRRVDILMRDYLYPHAQAFYFGIDTDEETGYLQKLLRGILIHHKPIINSTDIRAYISRRKKITRQEMEKFGSKAETLGWLTRIAGKNKRIDSLQWSVNPRLFVKFSKHAKRFIEENEERKLKMAESFKERAKLRGSENKFPLVERNH